MNKFKIVCYGDSNTWGYNPAENGSRYDDDIRWTQRLQNKLGNDFQVIEEGFSGRTTVFEDPVLEGKEVCLKDSTTFITLRLFLMNSFLMN